MTAHNCWASRCVGFHPATAGEEEYTQTDLARRAAAIRVRARRRIRLVLGVYPEGTTELAPLLKAALEIETLRRR